MTEHLILAERYLQEAARLDPADARLLGWLGGIKGALGQIHQDPRLSIEGYFLLREGIDRFPEFNYFAAAYGLSVLPANNALFREGLDYMWRNN